MANKAELQTHPAAEANEELTKLAKPSRRPRRRAGTVSMATARRGQRGKRRGQAAKGRSQGAKGRSQEELTAGVITVKRTYSDGGKRRWDKKHYCVFCRRPQVKIARHLLRKHSEQTEVQAASALPTGSKQRHVLLEALRCKGNYMHNIEVIRRGSGEIVPWRQPSEDVDPMNYLPCPLCLGFFLRADLWKHQASCRKRMTPDLCPDSASSDVTTLGHTPSDVTADSSLTAEATDSPDPSGTKRPDPSDPPDPSGLAADPGLAAPSRPRKRTRVQAAASRLLPISSGASESCSDVLHRMNQDQVSHQVKSDWLICKYGNKLMGSEDGGQRRYDYVSQKLRELGRFLLAAKALDGGVETLQDVLSPNRLRLALNAAREASGYRWTRPPLAVKTTLKTVCEIAIGESLQEGEWDNAAKVTDFYHKLGREWDMLELSPDTHTQPESLKLKKRPAVRSRKEPESKAAKQSPPPAPPQIRPLPSMVPPPTGPLGPPRRAQRRPWSALEKEAVWRQLGVHVLVQSVPGKEVCQRCLALEPVLRGRHWKDLKNQVHNQIQSQKKLQFHQQMDQGGPAGTEEMDQTQNQPGESQSQAEGRVQPAQISQPEREGRVQPAHLIQSEREGRVQQSHLIQSEREGRVQQSHLIQSEREGRVQTAHLIQPEREGRVQTAQISQSEREQRDRIQDLKKQQFITQIEPDQTIKQHYSQPVQNQQTQQTQVQSQVQSQVQGHHHKKPFDRPDLQGQKKSLYQLDEGLDQQGLRDGPGSYGAAGPHRASGPVLLQRDPSNPYPLTPLTPLNPLNPLPPMETHRSPLETHRPHMEPLMSRAEWTDQSMSQQHYSGGPQQSGQHSSY